MNQVLEGFEARIDGDLLIIKPGRAVINGAQVHYSARFNTDLDEMKDSVVIFLQDNWTDYLHLPEDHPDWAKLQESTPRLSLSMDWTGQPVKERHNRLLLYQVKHGEDGEYILTTLYSNQSE